MTFDVRKMTTEDFPACVVIRNHIIALGGSTAYEDPYTETHFANSPLGSGLIVQKNTSGITLQQIQGTQWAAPIDISCSSKCTLVVNQF